MGILGNGGFDWNNNGKRDAFDSYMDKKIINSNSGDSNEFRPQNNQLDNNNGIVILKCLLVVLLCIGGMILPIILDMSKLGTLLCCSSAVGLSIFILKFKFKK